MKEDKRINTYRQKYALVRGWSVLGKIRKTAQKETRKQAVGRIESGIGIRSDD